MANYLTSLQSVHLLGSMFLNALMKNDAFNSKLVFLVNSCSQSSCLDEVSLTETIRI